MGVSSSKPRLVQTKWFNEFESKLPSLKGKTVAVTGCTSGTGYIVARTAARKGAENVLMLNRPSGRSEKAETDLREEIEKVSSSTKVESIPCDLQDFQSVQKAADTIKSKYDAVDVLCNNAGVMALEDRATKDGFDVQMQTNHLSHFLLTKELYPLLERAAKLRGEARIANHASIARHGDALDEKYFGKNGGNLGGDSSSLFLGGARWVRYQQSKKANSVFTAGLAEKLEHRSSSKGKVISSVAEPGLAATNLQVNTASEGGMGSEMWIMLFAQSQEDGSMPICSACFDPTTTNGSLWQPKRWNALRGPATMKPIEKPSRNKADIETLWKMSEQACGPFDI